MNIRKICFEILENVFTKHLFLSDLLVPLKQKIKNDKDYKLLWTLAYGTLQRWFYLEQVAKNSTKKLKLKRREKICAYMGLYQLIFLTRLPKYAIMNEQLKLAKTISFRFSQFLNHLLQNYRLPNTPIFHPFLEQKLKTQYGKKSGAIVEALCQRPILFARNVKTNDTFSFEAKELEQVAKDPNFYIQNPTPISLMMQAPMHPCQTILDLCASPGGKALLAHALFHPEQLVVNDISQKKLRLLKANMDKYHIECQLTQYDGTNYPLDQRFDLVIVDAPCSNSGVLNKRPEALFRLNEETIKEQVRLQKALLKRALQLGTQVIYSTCSILKEENEQVVDCFKDQASIIYQKTMLPNDQGLDGGFIALLSNKTPQLQKL
jgi:16S rRNA (cytosine967-C5)-methyltransferase